MEADEGIGTVDGGGGSVVEIEESKVSNSALDFTPSKARSTNWRYWAAIVAAVGVAIIVGFLIGFFSKPDGSDSSSNNSQSDSVKFAQLPSQDSVLTSIAFGSCAEQNFAQPFWDVLLSANLGVQLFIYSGDNVYGDCYSTTCARLQTAYDTLAENVNFQNAKDKLPIMAIPDDHDYGKNDCDNTNPYKALAKQKFLEFFEVSADDVRRSRDGLYIAKTFGASPRKVQVILLDTRWFRGTFTDTDEPYAPLKERYLRNWSSDASATMLGETQWTWLQKQFEEPADLRLVVSTVQIIAEGHGWERWGNFPLEIQRLSNLIQSTKANGVVFLTGDRHIGAIYNMTASLNEDGSRNPTPYPLIEVTSSALTHTSQCQSTPCIDEPGPWRKGPLMRDNNIGLILVDWDTRSVNISLRRTDKSPGFSYDAGAIEQSIAFSLDDLVVP